jgi:hypothetical protein
LKNLRFLDTTSVDEFFDHTTIIMTPTITRQWGNNAQKMERTCGMAESY